MFETVKVVNGYAITRLVGSQRFYTVRLGAHRFVTFHTIKAAAAYIQAL